MPKMHIDLIEYNQAQKADVDSSNTEQCGNTPKKRKLEAIARQMKLEKCVAKKQLWDINDSRSKMIHEKIFKMIVLDIEPFSKVEDQGFIELIAHLEPRYLIPGRTFFTQIVCRTDIRSTAWHDSEGFGYG